MQKEPYPTFCQDILFDPADGIRARLLAKNGAQNKYLPHSAQSEKFQLQCRKHVLDGLRRNPRRVQKAQQKKKKNRVLGRLCWSRGELNPGPGLHFDGNRC